MCGDSDWWEGRWSNLASPKVVKLSDRVEVEWFKQVSPISAAAPDEIAVSGIGTIAAAPRAEGWIGPVHPRMWVKPHVDQDQFFKVGYARVGAPHPVGPVGLHRPHRPQHAPHPRRG